MNKNYISNIRYLLEKGYLDYDILEKEEGYNQALTDLLTKLK